MHKDAHKYASECTSCHGFKIDRTGPKGIGGEYPIPPFILHTAHADFTGAIHGTDGHSVIMTFIDALSRHLIAVPAENSTAETAARILVTEATCNFGTPTIPIADNGTALKSELFEHVCKVSRITHLTTAPYTPQSNGSIGRVRQTLKMKLRQTVSQGGADWKETLPLVVAAMNDSEQASRLSASEIALGRPPAAPSDWTPTLTPQTPPPLNLKAHFEELQSERMAKIVKQASYREENTHRRREKQAERVRAPLAEGGLVLYTALKERRTKNMHSPAYAGPARIKQTNGSIAILELLSSGVHYNLRPGKDESWKSREYISAS